MCFAIWCYGESGHETEQDKNSGKSYTIGLPAIFIIAEKFVFYLFNSLE